jgi:hypothetical protein
VNRITLQRVQYLPRELAPGILYVSDEFAVAGHLCACGCGNKVVTPLGPAEWTFTERNGRPTLHPSIGNWQLPCRSHYVIAEGQIRWGDQWSEAQVFAGRPRGDPDELHERAEGDQHDHDDRNGRDDDDHQGRDL